MHDKPCIYNGVIKDAQDKEAVSQWLSTAKQLVPSPSLLANVNMGAIVRVRRKHLYSIFIWLESHELYRIARIEDICYHGHRLYILNIMHSQAMEIKN